ncbi:hypothetical protein PHLCEN_2v6130 [Hermanssonia centrifuga]|uniref:Uncharacterized protein n=1 Tax=Hermanssonia centrifuga TaxID=98765 RepID=A0A2R6P076_9APHY|nr:hypothetical protein PHLCEN_2v6130 [Hermanssonia centrifuga]
MPNNFVFIAFYFILPKRKDLHRSCFFQKLISFCAVFLNSLLATLNAREKLRDHSTATGGVVSIPLSTAMTSPTNPKQSSRFSQGFSPGFSQESVDQVSL